MRTLIVYESMYGNTRAIAEAIGESMRNGRDLIEIVHVSEVTDEMVTDADLLIVGAPTHIHTLPSSRSRHAAVAGTQKNTALHIEPNVATGIREWLATLPARPAQYAAAFDTRLPGPAMLTGRASRLIARTLRREGRELIDQPKSFLVTKANVLEADEVDAAFAWGYHVGRELRFRARLESHAEVAP